MHLTSSLDGFVLRSISILALLGVLTVPVAAEATSGGEEPTTTGDEGGDVGSGGGAGSGDGTGTGGGSGSGDGTASPPASTGEAMTDDATAGSTSGATGDVAGPDPDDDSKGCSIGARGTAPGMLALALLGLVGLRRRRT
jgi:vitamin B12 transporter